LITRTYRQAQIGISLMTGERGGQSPIIEMEAGSRNTMRICDDA